MSKTQTWATHFVGDAEPTIRPINVDKKWLLSHGPAFDMYFDNFQHLCEWHDRVGALIQAEHREAIDYAQNTSYVEALKDETDKAIKEQFGPDEADYIYKGPTIGNDHTALVMKALSLYSARAKGAMDLDARDAVLEELGL